MFKRSAYIIIALIFSGQTGVFPAPPARAEAVEIRDIFFPTDAKARLTDTFGAPRGTRTHEGEDIMGEQMMPLYAAVDGVVSTLIYPEAAWGYAVALRDVEGYTYHYLHVNNDTPGTNDDQGGFAHAYAPGMRVGAVVARGQLLGWMGNSGNAEGVSHHLHFEIRRPDGIPIDPYPSLVSALERPLEIDYDIETVLAASPDIDADKGLVAAGSSACPGALVKLAGADTVYYCGVDGRRYVFPSDKIFFSWYEDFSQVQELGLEAIAALPLAGNVTYRPGTRLAKIQTDPKVYAVSPGGTLRWLRSQEIAVALYGDDWNQWIDDVPDSLFMSYRVGEPI